ncbi:unnamed protein product [Gongylonema pulchrum]|uniref:Protein kinase domain-containing protein n=1 Tax=Gongylonema pulchrum TaxID=637853 RepID=A0A183EPK9_9BILA|nr:unnamed protein product [Gongylonema pulchrum]
MAFRNKFQEEAAGAVAAPKRNAAVEVASPKLRRSESTSCSRTNRYIAVKNRRYIVINLLGKGGSSLVYQVLDEEQKKLQAVKCVDLSEADAACRSAYLNEIKLLIRIVHSDLKPANFLLVGGNLKLIDFGIASAIPSNRTSVMKDTQMGTLSYMPPEAINSSCVTTENGKELYRVCFFLKNFQNWPDFLMGTKVNS